MAQTKEGALKAVETTRKRHGDNFFKLRAQKAGRSSSTQFKKGERRASELGLKGVAKKYAKN